ncbi:hypothetical protein MUCCIDRAFT_182437 [Mucor lusitanicus CBS 277.49]|uniref:Uncharacterized protein n=1 Tax=Mucor lusitanicus CBS 277.49 TaxID=747725 RepID=A0A168PWV2_MUCCL|nr:hypothetical protein MUCCIDRAFT_182437 [Mucor lusitanicus CBS 277.49]
MALASFPLLVRRWNRSKLHHIDYSKYTQLVEYMPEDVFLTRLKTIDKHVYNEYPHVWVDTYLFLTAIMLVVATAAFSVVARAANLSMWYPLIILVVPIVIGFITTRRRNAYYTRLSKSCLKEMNSLDVTRQVKWSFRRLRENDTAAVLHLRPPLTRYHINFVVDVIQINTENELADEGEMLPAYHTAMMDVVLDIGPEMEQAPGNRSNYISVRMPSSSASPLPPAYEHHELEPVHPPPEYINNAQSTMPSSTSQSNTRDENNTTNAPIR